MVEYNSNLYTRLGILEEKLNTLLNIHDLLLKSLTETVTGHGLEIAVLKSEMLIIKKLAWGVIGCSFFVLTFVIGAVLKLVVH